MKEGIFYIINFPWKIEFIPHSVINYVNNFKKYWVTQI